MNCPGSIALSKTVPPKAAGKFADEGTAAHSLAEKCFALGLNPEDFLGSEIEVNGVMYEVDNEMVENVAVYVDYVNELAKHPGASVDVEVKFELPAYHADLGGTADAVVIAGDTIHVCDLKYGRGVVVHAIENTQAMIYGLGALTTLKPKGVTKVALTIVQPRAKDASGNTIRSWSISAEELLAWGANVLKPACEKAYTSTELKSGEWCRFCPAQPVCKAQQEQAMAVCLSDFDLDKPKTAIFPPAQSLTMEQIVAMMGFLDNAVAYLKSIQAYAQSMAESGKKVPGYKLVAKRANRKWNDPKAVEKYLSEKLGEAAYQPKEIISPTLAEKLLKKDPELTKFITRPDNGMSLVPESDPRQELKGVASEFVSVVDFLQ